MPDQNHGMIYSIVSQLTSEKIKIIVRFFWGFFYKMIFVKKCRVLLCSIAVTVLHFKFAMFVALQDLNGMELNQRFQNLDCVINEVEYFPCEYFWKDIT